MKSRLPPFLPPLTPAPPADPLRHPQRPHLPPHIRLNPPTTPHVHLSRCPRPPPFPLVPPQCRPLPRSSIHTQPTAVTKLAPPPSHTRPPPCLLRSLRRGPPAGPTLPTVAAARLLRAAPRRRPCVVCLSVPAGRRIRRPLSSDEPRRAGSAVGLEPGPGTGRSGSSPRSNSVQAAAAHWDMNAPPLSCLHPPPSALPSASSFRRCLSLRSGSESESCRSQPEDLQVDGQGETVTPPAGARRAGVQPPRRGQAVIAVILSPQCELRLPARSRIGPQPDRPAAGYRRA